VARSRQARLWERIAAGQVRNIGFIEFCRLVEAFGFELRRVSGSHHIYRHPGVPRPLNLQPRNGEAKPYQIGQFLEMVEDHGLSKEARQ
jgi:HicA toxin of bacterial toxin-antitoxin,